MLWHLLLQVAQCLGDLVVLALEHREDALNRLAILESMAAVPLSDSLRNTLV